jgi:hypothetical protein
MDCALGADVGPAGETVVGDLLLRVLLAVVNDLLGWSCQGSRVLLVRRLLRLFFSWRLGSIGRGFGWGGIFGRQLDD